MADETIMTSVGLRVLDPRHGVHAPTTGTPPRRPGSVRRTTTVDSLRPEKIGATFVLNGRGRDLVTAADGTTSVAAEATMDAEMAYDAGAVVRSIATTPVLAGIDALVGKTATTGFRAVIDDHTGAERGSLVYLLLEEIPVATLVSGYAVGVAAARGEVDMDELTSQGASMRQPGPPIHGRDDCAGFRSGGVIDDPELKSMGAVTGPEATPILDPQDPGGWHDMPAMQANGMRRWRRHDLWRDDDGNLVVDAFFRDSHLGSDGLETIVHEYTVSATIDGAASVVLACSAEPRVLPWRQCDEAAASAGRLVGMEVYGLRPRVRAEQLGPTTCTHLRDMLREIEDVHTLAALLPTSA